MKKYLIERYAVIDIIRKEDTIGRGIVEYLIRRIQALPVKSEQKIGRWINTEPNYKSGFGNNAYYCSVCKDYYTTSPSEMHYCPNCGAKMEGELDEQ